MTATRANCETILARRVGALFTAVGLDGATVSGSNADFNDPLGYAVRQCGGAVTDPTAVSDADIAGVSDADFDKLLDVAELRAMESALAAASTRVNITIGATSQSYASIATALAAAIATKSARLTAAYGLTAGQLTTGSISLGFQSSADDILAEA